MKRGIWGLVVGIVVLGALAGVAIGGRPETPVDLVITGTSSSSTSEVASPTSAVPPTEVSTSDADVSSTTVDQTSLREATAVVVANAAGQAGLASRAAALLSDAGWALVEPADAAITDFVNRAYYADGFEAAARLAAADLGLTAVEYTPLPERRLTVDDVVGDVVILVGGDIAS